MEYVMKMFEAATTMTVAIAAQVLTLCVILTC